MSHAQPYACCMLSFGWFPGVWILYADVSEHSVLFHRQVGACRIHPTRTYLPMKMEQNVPKRRHIKFRRTGITQKKAYNIQDTAKVWNQESLCFLLGVGVFFVVSVTHAVQLFYSTFVLELIYNSKSIFSYVYTFSSNSVLLFGMMCLLSVVDSLIAHKAVL